MAGSSKGIGQFCEVMLGKIHACIFHFATALFDINQSKTCIDEYDKDGFQTKLSRGGQFTCNHQHPGIA